MLEPNTDQFVYNFELVYCLDIIQTTTQLWATCTRPEVINSSTPEIDIDAVIANYNSQIDNFNSRVSSYQVD